MKLTWATLGLGLGVLALAGCEDGGLSFCTNRDDAGKCPTDDFPPVFDGGMDGATPPSSDGRVPDATTFVDGATVVLPDGAVVADASIDAATPDAAAPASYTVEEFCAAQYQVAKAWTDRFDDCCSSMNNTELQARQDFLAASLAYSDNGTSDSISNCVTGINGSIGANMTYVPTAAVACAAKYASQFTAPPATCPATGFAIETLEATIGHQIQVITQLAECRAAFVGKLALNTACTNTFTCQPGLRCLGTDNSKFCSQPRGNGAVCANSSECGDGLVCVGSTASGAGGRVCRPATEPVELNSNCGGSSECRTGTLCFNKCDNPANTLICAQ